MSNSSSHVVNSALSSILTTSNQSAQSSPLLVLPDELQIKIYRYFVKTWSLSIRDAKEHFGHDHGTAYTRGECVIFPASDCYALLQVCHKMRKVVEDVQLQAFSGHVYTFWEHNCNYAYPVSGWVNRVHTLHCVYIEKNAGEFSLSPTVTSCENLQHLHCLFVEPSIDSHEIGNLLPYCRYSYPDVQTIVPFSQDEIFKCAHQHLQKVQPSISEAIRPWKMPITVTIQLLNHDIVRDDYESQDIGHTISAFSVYFKDKSSMLITRAIVRPDTSSVWHEGVFVSGNDPVRFPRILRTENAEFRDVGGPPLPYRWVIPYDLRCQWINRVKLR